MSNIPLFDFPNVPVNCFPAVAISIISPAVSPTSNNFPNVFPAPKNFPIEDNVFPNAVNPIANEPISVDTIFSIISLKEIKASKAPLMKSDFAKVVTIEVHTSFNLFNLPAILSTYCAFFTFIYKRYFVNCG